MNQLIPVLTLDCETVCFFYETCVCVYGPLTARDVRTALLYTRAVPPESARTRRPPRQRSRLGLEFSAACTVGDIENSLS